MTKRKNDAPVEKSSQWRGFMILLLLVSACGIVAYAGQVNNNQVESPSAVQPVTRAVATPQAATIVPTSGINLEAMQSTSEAVSAPIRNDLTEVVGVDEVISVSALRVSDDFIVTIDLVSLIDEEAFLARLLETAHGSAPEINQMRVTIRSDASSSQGTIWLWEMGEWSSEQFGVIAPAAQIVQVTTQVREPRNCDEVVVMGLTAAQAAQWSHLDRDKDGVACYGD